MVECFIYILEGFFVLDNQSGFSPYKSTVCELLNIFEQIVKEYKLYSL